MEVEQNDKETIYVVCCWRSKRSIQRFISLCTILLTGGEAETVAYGAHCQQEEGLDRPVAGHTNICPGAIRTFVSVT